MKEINTMLFNGSIVDFDSIIVPVGKYAGRYLNEIADKNYCEWASTHFCGDLKEAFLIQFDYLDKVDQEIKGALVSSIVEKEFGSGKSKAKDSRVDCLYRLSEATLIKIHEDL